MKKSPLKRNQKPLKRVPLKKSAENPLTKKPNKNNGKKLKQTALKKADNNKGRKRNIRKKQIRKESTSSLSKEIKACDLAFSRWLRLSCADKDGMVGCYTCDYRGYWKNGGIEAGHFKSRTHKNTRWLRLNVACQCQMCNGYRSGNLKVFAANLVRDFGEGVVEHLDRESKKPVQLTVLKVRKLREYFEGQVVKLKAKLEK